MDDNSELFGRDLFGEPIKPPSRGPLSDLFTAPPFSVLSARDGWWQDRKRAWLALGVEAPAGREVKNPQSFGELASYEKTDNARAKIKAVGDSATVFDPVLCELVYRWFCKPGGLVFDPFAGGAVRGLVANQTGRKYWGVDIRPEQVAANQIQATKVLGSGEYAEAPGKAWQLGFDLDDLIEVCKVFNEYEKGAVMPESLYTRVTETMVAKWLDANKIALLEHEGRKVAAVVFGRCKTARTFKGFNGDAIRKAEAGDVVVSRLACAPGYERDLLSLIFDIGPNVMEIFQECPVSREIAMRAGMVWEGSKVRASSEIVGVWGWAEPNSVQPLSMPGLNEYGNAYPDHELAGIAELDLPIAFEDVERTAFRLREELDEDWWVNHYSTYNKGGSWSALALRGYGGCSKFIEKPSEMSKKWKEKNQDALGLKIEDTIIRRRFPEVEGILASIPGKKHRIRFMALDPGGRLARHADIKDPDAGTRNGELVRVHVPIITSGDVTFTQWKLDGGAQKGVFMAKGKAYSLDTRKPHEAINEGSDRRIHLVVDVECSAALRAAIARRPAPGVIESPAPLEPGLFPSEGKGAEPVTVEKETPRAPGEFAPKWIVGDAMECAARAPQCDLVFSCPPYGDLEVYSDLPRDLSAMDRESFSSAYAEIIKRSCERLKENRFAVFVVGDYRDRKTGFYRGLPAETERAFRSAGLELYNEIVLLQAIGSLGLRARRMFDSTRKVGKAHQNVLVFVKGDPRKATRLINMATQEKKESGA